MFKRNGSKKNVSKASALVSTVSAAAIILASGFGLALSAKPGDVYAYSKSDMTIAMDGYKNILRGYGEDMRKGTGSFMVVDLNSDGMPEMIYDSDGTPVSIDEIYTYSDGKVVTLDTSKMTVYRYGSYMVSADRKSFCIYRGGPASPEGMPYDYCEFEIKGNAIVEKDDFYGVEKDGSWECADKNGAISYDTFKSVTDSFKSVSRYQNNESNRVVQCNPDNFATDEYTWKGGNGKWWVVDADGNYPASKWLKIDGYWYYFDASGYMAANEWIGGWWLDADGTCTYSGVATWANDSSGWWYEDTTGWYAKSEWQKIDGNWYYFDGSGYMVTNQYVDGWWCGADGVCN